MLNDKKIQQIISFGIKELNISKKEYDNLKEETKKLIKINDIKINLNKYHLYIQKK